MGFPLQNDACSFWVSEYVEVLARNIVKQNTKPTIAECDGVTEGARDIEPLKLNSRSNSRKVPKLSTSVPKRHITIALFNLGPVHPTSAIYAINIGVLPLPITQARRPWINKNSLGY